MNTLKILEKNQARIKQLDNRLANQIAAGEVVERPASVVKELLENSVDAKANRIEVDVERGGTRLIRITDNGCGIVRDDLNLALARHATSKISRSEDLAEIESLGFRGEALASIASVSRLTLTSRTKESEFAWQAIAEGRDMAVKIQPASATVGTRIEVRDLFYNTPARQKFLRAEKTEFAHIEEIFKRHALANYRTAFILKHNHKVVKRVPAGLDESDYLRRIETICGKPFAQNAVEFACSHELLKVKGWTGGVKYHRSESDIHYVFVNGRPVKDKMLNHAIRQSFQGLLPAGRMPTYVVFLQIEPSKIDVNVHPTKHEVRFDEQRMVHDLIVHSISESLTSENTLDFDSQPIESKLSLQEQTTDSTDYRYTPSPQIRATSGVAYQRPSYLDSLSAVNKQNLSASQSEQSEVSNLVQIGKTHYALMREQSLVLIKTEKFLTDFLSYCINNSSPIESKRLLFPHKLSINIQNLEQVEVVNLLLRFGFEFSPHNNEQVLLRGIPLWLSGVENEQIYQLFCDWAQAISAETESEGGLENFESNGENHLLNKLALFLKPISREVVQWIGIESQFSLSHSDAAVEMNEQLANKVC